MKDRPIDDVTINNILLSYHNHKTNRFHGAVANNCEQQEVPYPKVTAPKSLWVLSSPLCRSQEIFELPCRSVKIPRITNPNLKEL